MAQTVRDLLNEKELKSWKATERILFTKLPSECDPNELYLKDKGGLNQRLDQSLTYLDYCRQMCSEKSKLSKSVFEETIRSEKRLKDKHWNKGDIAKLKVELKQATDILEVAQDLGIQVRKKWSKFCRNLPVSW